MLSSTVKAKIENTVPAMFESNRFFLSAQNGSFTKENLALYCYNLMHVFQETTKNLSLAANRANELGQSEYAKFLESKIDEEKGHDEWARSDLKNLLGSALEVREDLLTLTPETRSVLDYTKKIIQDDPRFYLVYMTFVEYLTILVAPELFRNLEEKCGITRQMLTAIANHEVADKEHSAEDFKMLELYGNDPRIENDMLQVLDESTMLVGSSLESFVTMQ